MRILRVLFVTLPCIVVSPAVSADPGAAGKEWTQRTLRTGELHGECLALRAGDGLHYAFSARDKLDFNINFTSNGVMHFLVKKPGVKSADAVFRAVLAREYCLMWSNPRDQPVVFRYQLEIRAD